MKTKIIVTFALCAVSAIASVAQGSDTATLQNYQKWQSRHTLQGYRWTVEAAYEFDIDNTKVQALNALDDKIPIDNRNFNFATVHGYQFNNFFYLGAGIGVQQYTAVNATSMPIFADLRVNFLNDRKLTPYADFRIGGAIGRIGGFRATAMLGVRIKTIHRQAALIGIGITKESDYPCHAVSGTEYFEGTTLGIRIGYEF